MIPNQWYVVLSSKQVKTKPVGVIRMGEKMVFWRDAQGKVSCFPDQCVHRGVQLSRGKVLNGDRLQCPFHGLEYDRQGRVQCIPSNGRIAPVPEHFQTKSYPTYEAHSFIWIWWGDNPPEDLSPPRFFEDFDEDRLCWAEVIDPWDVHYSRVLENQLDTIHVPFVHTDSFGRGGRYVCDGPGFMWLDEDMFMAQPMYHTEDGTIAKKSEDLEMPLPREYKMEFIFPNIWENYITEKMRIIAAFVPVDETHTLLYGRIAQGFVQLPGLRKLISLSMLPLVKHILKQDRGIVNTRRHKASQLRSGEKLVQGDKPIIEYRKRRAELIEKAKSD